jgi:hypothetical protein
VTQQQETAVPEKVTEVIRLTKDQYLALEKRAMVPVVTSATTPLEAAAALAQQSLLKLIRDGFTIGE